MNHDKFTKKKLYEDIQVLRERQIFMNLVKSKSKRRQLRLSCVNTASTNFSLVSAWLIYMQEHTEEFEDHRVKPSSVVILTWPGSYKSLGIHVSYFYHQHGLCTFLSNIGKWHTCGCPSREVKGILFSHCILENS